MPTGLSRTKPFTAQHSRRSSHRNSGQVGLAARGGPVAAAQLRSPILTFALYRNQPAFNRSRPPDQHRAAGLT